MTLLITNLKPSITGHTCTIFLTDQSSYILPLDWAVKLSLRPGLELPPDLLLKIKHQSSFYRLREYALRQIAISPKTEKILRQKMNVYCRKHQLKLPKTTEIIINDFKSNALLDEQKYVEYYLRRYPQKSLLILKHELLHKGISRDNILKNIHEDSNKNIAIIQTILTKKKVTPKILIDFKQKNRILSMILRKGFSIGEAKSAIDDYLKTRYNKLS